MSVVCHFKRNRSSSKFNGLFVCFEEMEQCLKEIGKGEEKKEEKGEESGVVCHIYSWGERYFSWRVAPLFAISLSSTLKQSFVV